MLTPSGPGETGRPTGCICSTHPSCQHSYFLLPPCLRCWDLSKLGCSEVNLDNFPLPGLKEALRVGRGNLGTQSLCEGLHIQALSGQGQTARTALPERWKELGEERLGRESTRLGEQMLRERRRRGERRHPEEVGPPGKVTKNANLELI